MNILMYKSVLTWIIIEGNIQDFTSVNQVYGNYLLLNLPQLFLIYFIRQLLYSLYLWSTHMYLHDIKLMHQS